MLKKINSLKKAVAGFLLLTLCVINIGNAGSFIASANAQEQATDTTLNETQKLIFTEAKKAANEDKNTRNSLIMIGLVLCVVAFAMYLAFRNDESDKKQTFARTPKKDF